MTRIRATVLMLFAAAALAVAPAHANQLPIYYTVSNADSVMVQCDGQLNRNEGGDHSSTTGQAFSYGCGSAPTSNFMMGDHDGSMLKCNGGNPGGNGVWLPLLPGQQAVVYCVSGTNPSPAPSGTPTPSPTPAPSPSPTPTGEPTPPPLTNPQNPISYGADATGASDSTSAFKSAAGAGDIDVPAGTFLINTGGINLNGRNLRCESGAIFKQTVLAQRTMFQIDGAGSVFNCDFRGPYYNVNGAGYQTFFEDFLHLNPPSN